MKLAFSQGLPLFVRQDLRQRFTGNVVGVAWSIILPLLQLALFGLLFVQIFKARAPASIEVSYMAFLALGMWPWFAFSEAVGRGAGALVENAGLLAKVAVPYWHLVVARVLVAFALHGLGFVLVLAVLQMRGDALAWAWLPWVLLMWLALLLLATALACALAVLQVFVRDIGQIIPYLLTAMLFTAPILYAPELVPAPYADWLYFNPLAQAITAIRQPLIGAALPDGWWQSGCAAILWGGLGLAVYRRLEAHVEDFL